MLVPKIPRGNAGRNKKKIIEIVLQKIFHPIIVEEVMVDTPFPHQCRC